MKQDNKLWAVLIHLSGNMWWSKAKGLDWMRHKPGLALDDETWEFVVNGAAEAGFNTIVLDVGDGIRFDSHPEIAVHDAWTKQRLRRELERCRALGITLIPKLNFATTHDMWLGEYSRMISTNLYYQVCADLIREVYELFDRPQYIHIGMDEESPAMIELSGVELAIYRRGALLWHDLRFLLDRVKATGAKPWIWHDLLFGHPDECRQVIAPGEAVINPWYYRSFRREHFSPMPEERKQELGDFAYLEEGNFFTTFRKHACPLAHAGYEYVPTASVCGNNPYNAFELMEHFELGAPDSSILGYMTAPWCSTVAHNKAQFAESFRTLRQARAKFYE